ncbi:acid phosphatase AphA [Xenorhabdus bovienii]|uniref:acid phosphatase AphA n=1 Tax=Xenorhabdus bovienii TaxID=40576 RepID=UPI003DA1DA68
MRKVMFTLNIIVLAVGLNSIAQAKIQMPEQVSSGVTAVELSQRQPVHWVSVEQIEISLQNQPPMAVGFDVDDTVLFSSSGFYRGKSEYSPNDESYLKNPEFWNKMNNEWNNFSMPKQIGITLVQMHLKRGDDIYFITGRKKTKTEKVTHYIQESLNIPTDKMNAVNFSDDKLGKNNKFSWIKEHKLKIYYGDADSDIAVARALNIRGIRILRASNSSYQPLPKAGRFGEEVVIKSEY